MCGLEIQNTYVLSYKDKIYNCIIKIEILFN